MIACLVIPGFELRAALRERPRLQAEPAALAPEPGTEPLLGPVTASAEAAGVRPGDAPGRGARDCARRSSSSSRIRPAAEQAWEEILRRLEDAGFSVEPADARLRLLRDARRRAALRRRSSRRSSARSRRSARLGRARRRGRAAVRGARGGERRAAGPGARRLRRAHARSSSRRCRSTLLPLEARAAARSCESSECEGLESLPGCRAAPWPNVWGRTAGAPGAWREAERGGASRGGARRAELVERLEFPEAVGNELTLRRAFGVLLDRLLARPERGGRARCARSRSAARLVGGGSWRRTVTLRDADRRARPAARRARRRSSRSCRRRSLELRLELVELTESTGQQLELVQPAGSRAARAPQRGPASGAREHRLGLGLHRRGGRAVVAHPGSSERCSFRGTTERAQAGARRGEARRHRRGTSNRQAVALVREEWRVVDRWWTEEPVDRRYFELVLETGRERASSSATRSAAAGSASVPSGT